MADYINNTFQPTQIVADGLGLWSRQITIASGQNLVAGSVLGKVTASGEYILSLAAATDGSEVPAAILPEDIDASAGVVQTPAYMGGLFIESNLTLGTGHTVSSIFDQLRGVGIKLVTAISA